MTKLINSKDQLPLASENECKTRRALLIASGAIKPGAKSEIVAKKNGVQVLSTRRSSKTWRNKLVEQGIIDPVYPYESTIDRTGFVSKEEGKYDPQPIETEAEYVRRKNIYLWLISDILKTRKELKLDLGKKDDTDPDWYF